MGQIVSLNDRPELAEACAAWSYGEWGFYVDGMCLEGAFDYFDRSVRDLDLPDAFVMVVDNKPVGMAVLKRTEHPDREDLSPWFGSLFVQPHFRKRGYAKALLQHLEHVAYNKYGFNEIYLQTHIPNYYAAAGWESIGEVADTIGVYGKNNILMKKTLSE